MAITDAGMCSIASLKALKTLVVGIDDNQAESIYDPFNPGTTINTGQQPRISDAGLGVLVMLPKLHTLIMSHCTLVTDAGLKILEHFPSLRELQLNGAVIRGVGFPRLNLVAMNLMDCYNLDDVGLFTIGKNCPSLMNLYLFRSWGISKAAYYGFRERFPHCQAHIEGRDHIWGFD